MGTAFFVEGVEEFFFRCTWVKNDYRGGDAFGCCSLGVGGEGEEEKILYIKENN